MDDDSKFKMMMLGSRACTSAGLALVGVGLLVACLLVIVPLLF